jgi:hypothetical protein
MGQMQTDPACTKQGEGMSMGMGQKMREPAMVMGQMQTDPACNKQGEGMGTGMGMGMG